MAQKLRLSDYREPSYSVRKINLTFEIFHDHTEVTNQMYLKRNLNVSDDQVILNGDGQEILSFEVDGEKMQAKPYLRDKDLHLLLKENEHVIKIKTKIYPKTNTSFEGLYASNNNYFTQCEAEGFRKITYYLDRPDILAKFTTTIIAEGFQVLLSNGNLVEESREGNKIKVVWEDPYPKPSYLFALVAGNFESIRETFKTRSGREALLEVYVDPGMLTRAHYAMKSLKEAMKWDEDRYDLEYDLDRYMIVAANDFNFGAMENKGLNIFNAKYVLADQESATDMDFYNIQSVVGHEYFHNWTGNRVTCRDWFQLSLKEGLTVYRDQEFSSDLNSRAVKRINDVVRLRESQFPEDAGPNSHPVRPSEAYNISNFYTATIYEKGAELVRMIETLIGREKFKQGITKYFELFDGQAVTTEDFCYAMEQASGKDLTYFQRWYTQKGTPRLEVKKGDTETLTLNFNQTTKPLLIPMLMGFIDDKGDEIRDFKIRSATCDYQVRGANLLVELVKEEENLSIDLPKNTRVSLLRDFSAPILLDYQTDKEELFDLAAFDTNDFCRWEALQTLAKQALLDRIQNKTKSFDEKIFQIYQRTLRQPIKDPAFVAKLFLFPKFETLKLEFSAKYPIDAIEQATDDFCSQVGSYIEEDALKTYQEMAKLDSPAARSLKNRLLEVLCRNPEFHSLAGQQFKTATNMTDSLGALAALKDFDTDLFNECLDVFYKRWCKDSLVYTKFLALKFLRKNPLCLDDLENIEKDSAFQTLNPNHNYSSFGALGLHNPFMLHHKSGRAYKLLADRIAFLDEKNPHVAARLASCFNDYKRLNEERAKLMKAELERLLQRKLSTNTYEILHNALN